jgi:8-oxo-dGTP pyrophosphatase MutT (NUDIX family)
METDKQSKIASPYYRVSLKAIAFEDQSNTRILVLKTKDGNWELPGGGWEHGESMQYCLRRELMEEVGVGIDNIDFETMYPYSSKGRIGNMRLKLAIPVSLTNHKFELDDYFTDYKFVDSKELSSLSMVDSEAGIKVHIGRIWRS